MSADEEKAGEETFVAMTAREVERFDLRAASELTGLRVERIIEVTEAKMVRKASGSVEEPVFDERGLSRLLQVADLVDRQGLSLEMMRTIAGLLDRLERAEAELRFLREKGRGED